MLMLNQNSGCVITNTCGGTGRALAAAQEPRTPGLEREGDARVYYECFGVKWNYFGLLGVARFGL